MTRSELALRSALSEALDKEVVDRIIDGRFTDTTVSSAVDTFAQGAVAAALRRTWMAVMP